MFYFVLVFAGVLSGILGGMGMGGGTLLIPLLTIFFNFNQKVAQGINLISFSIMAMVVVVIHAKNKLVNFKIAFVFFLLALLTSVVGALLASIVKVFVLRVFYGWLLIFIAIYEALLELKKLKNK